MTKYMSFSGQAMRSEYWGVQILGFVAMLVLMFIAGLLVGFGDSNGAIMPSVTGASIMVSTIVLYVWLILATTARRCRDAGVNVWWTAGVLIPYIGWVILIALGIIKTDEQTDSLPKLG